MLNQYAYWLIRWRWFVVLTVFTSVVLAALGAQHLSLKNDYRMFFSEDDPNLLAFEELQNTYTQNNNVLFVLEPSSGDIFSRESLAAIELLTEWAWQTPYSSRVDSITNFQNSIAKGDDMHVDALVRNAMHLDTSQIARIKHIALNEPLLVNRLVSPSGDVTGININIQLPAVEKGDEVIEIANFARDLRDKLTQQYPEITVYITGLTMMNAAFPESSVKDFSTLIPLMLLLVMIVMGIILRMLWGTVVTLISIFLAIAVAMGCAGWLGISLSPTSAIAPNIILTVVVAYSIHILSTLKQQYRSGLNKQEAIAETLRQNMRPLFLSSLTTVIGFLSMNSSDAPPFHDLGNITAMGIATAFLLSVMFLPALLAILPKTKTVKEAKQSSAMNWLASFVIDNRTSLFWTMLLSIVLLVACIPKNVLNDEYVKYWDESVEFRQATEFTTDRLTGIYYVDYSLRAPDSSDINNPEFIAHVERLANWLRSQPEVLHVNSITDIFKRVNMNMHGDEPEQYRLPERKDLAAQYLLLYEMSLPYGLDLNDRVDIDKSATRLTVSLQSLSSVEVLAFEERVQQWLKSDNRNNTVAKPAHGSGLTIMFAHIGQRNIRSMLVGTVIALLLISLVLVVALRSVKLGLISLIPNLVPVAMGFGLWGLLVGQVSLALSVVTAITLGIVVDDTVHFLSKYLTARRELNMSPEQAIRHTFTTVGTAIWTTSIALIIGFAVLIFSSFVVNSSMGLLTAIIIFFALIADFIFLPALLLMIEEKRYAKISSIQPVTDTHAA